ncbi:MAG TPA: hypothetical protein ENN99_11985 [Chloroflexi bacterium]|nr:hypothetical protein [Chloroflexota bacterium]
MCTSYTALGQRNPQYKRNNLLICALFLIQVAVFLPLFWPQGSLVDAVGPLLAAALGFGVAYRGAGRP